jgi:hypothetical protein
MNATVIVYFTLLNDSVIPCKNNGLCALRKTNLANKMERHLPCMNMYVGM